MSEQSGGIGGKIVNTASHVIFIVILFILPEVMMTIAMPHRNGLSIYPGFYVKTLVYIAVFYANYLYITDRTIASGSNRRHIATFLVYNIGLVLVGLAVCWVATNVWFPAPHRRHKPRPEHYYILKAASSMLRDVFMLILTIALAVALRLGTKWKDLQRQRQELLANQRSVELDNLKSQLNPHFLFNTLNTIYVLIAVAPDKAQGAVHRLSGLLRYMLYEDEASVTLSQEADFVENYVSLMRLRLSGRETILDIDISGHGDVNVPPLLFIPLVENAFKYGIVSDDDTPVAISLRVEGDSVVCRTSNSYMPITNGHDRSYSGIGLANLRRRLSLIYGGRASLSTVADGRTFTATLTIPL